jgi:hypothetical protein
LYPLPLIGLLTGNFAANVVPATGLYLLVPKRDFLRTLTGDGRRYAVHARATMRRKARLSSKLQLKVRTILLVLDLPSHIYVLAM